MPSWATSGNQWMVIAGAVAFLLLSGTLLHLQQRDSPFNNDMLEDDIEADGLASLSPLLDSESRKTARYGTGWWMSPRLGWEAGTAAALAELPIRKFGVFFKEATSYNPEMLNGDFGHYLKVDGEEVVLFDAMGEGCIPKWYITTDRDCQQCAYWSFRVWVDGDLVIDLPLNDTEGTRRRSEPFTYPLTSTGTVRSGYSSYFPVVYRRSVRVTLRDPAWTADTPALESLLRTTRNCIHFGTKCPFKDYWGIAHHQYALPRNTSTLLRPSLSKMAEQGVAGGNSTIRRTKVTGRLGVNTQSHINRLKTLWKKHLYIARLPEDGRLLRFAMVPGSRNFILRKEGRGSVVSLLVSIEALTKVKVDWGAVRVTMRWDNADPPQVDDVPLDAFFLRFSSRGTGQSLLLGTKPFLFQEQSSTGTVQSASLPFGYVFYPMPFFTSAEIYLVTDEVGYVCRARVDVSRDPYHPNTTAYFHATHSRYHKEDVSRPLRLINTTGWGHVVGVTYMLRNDSALTLEGDFTMRWDRSRTDNYIGTGVEDYFNFAHWCPTGQVGMYPFHGCLKNAASRKHIDVSLYRIQLLDYIPFQDGLQGHVQSWESEDLTALNSEFHRISAVTYYYARPRESGLRHCGTLHHAMQDTQAKLKFVAKPQVNAIVYRPNATQGFFTLTSALFDPQGTTRQAFKGRAFAKGESYKVTFTIPPHNYGVVLARTFNSKFGYQHAVVRVEGHVVGDWLVPNNNPYYLVREEHYPISVVHTEGRSKITVNITVLSDTWADVSLTCWCVV